MSQSPDSCSDASLPTCGMPAPSPPANGSVLVVEDHDLSASLLLELLRAALPGRALHRASSARTGFAAFSRLRPSLLVVDIGLPDTSGIQLTRRISAVDPAAPVVIYSVQDSAAIREGATAAGARAFVSKNKPGELLEVIKQLLATAHGIENSPQHTREHPTDAGIRGT